jgi:hypothetical protein
MTAPTYQPISRVELVALLEQLRAEHINATQSWARRRRLVAAARKRVEAEQPTPRLARFELDKAKANDPDIVDAAGDYRFARGEAERHFALIITELAVARALGATIQ